MAEEVPKVEESKQSSLSSARCILGKHPLHELVNFFIMVGCTDEEIFHDSLDANLLADGFPREFGAVNYQDDSLQCCLYRRNWDSVVKCSIFLQMLFKQCEDVSDIGIELGLAVLGVNICVYVI